MTEGAKRVLDTRDRSLQPDPVMMFFLVLLLLGGITSITEGVAPTSINALLPSWAVAIWSWSLVIVTAVSLVGNIMLVFRRHRWGLPLVQTGAALTGLATLYYACCVFIYAGLSGIMPGALSLGFAAVCLWKWRQITAIINEADRQAAVNTLRKALNGN